MKYKIVEIKNGNSTEPVQYVGVYVLNWQKEWGEPEYGFVEEEPYELPTKEEIRRIIYDDSYPKEWKDKTPFEKTRYGEDAAKAITKLIKGER